MERKRFREFGYHIQPVGRGWQWVVFNRDGGERARGRASSKAEAAAWVIRALADEAIGRAA